MKKPNFSSNFIKGMGSILDLFPCAPKNPVEGKSISELIRNDWEKVGNEMKDVMKQIDDEIKS